MNNFGLNCINGSKTKLFLQQGFMVTHFKQFISLKLRHFSGVETMKNLPVNLKSPLTQFSLPWQRGRSLIGYYSRRNRSTNKKETAKLVASDCNHGNTTDK